jgi:hypothetical protein
VSGHVVDFFFPEARLIVDSTLAPRFLGLQLGWLTISHERLANGFQRAIKDIQDCVIDRTGVIAYDDPRQTQEIPPIPLIDSPRWRAMKDAAIHA